MRSISFATVTKEIDCPARQKEVAHWPKDKGWEKDSLKKKAGDINAKLLAVKSFKKGGMLS